VKGSGVIVVEGAYHWILVRGLRIMAVVSLQTVSKLLKLRH
jgi:hypothetical protein